MTRYQHITVVVEEILDDRVVGAGVKHAVLAEEPQTPAALRWGEISLSVARKGQEAWKDARRAAGREEE